MEQEATTSTARAAPMCHVDLTQYEGLSDREVAVAMGVPRDEVRTVAFLVRRERALRLKLPAGRTRCEAGLPQRAGLQCRRPAMAGEVWCHSHHPSPPARASEGAAAMRLARAELWRRPDGDVLQALYEVSDWLERLDDSNRQVLDRLATLEQMHGERRQWLNTAAAAAYTGRSRNLVRAAAAAGHLSGVRQTPHGSWAFRPADLDAILTEILASPAKWTRSGQTGAGGAW